MYFYCYVVVMLDKFVVIVVEIGVVMIYVEFDVVLNWIVQFFWLCGLLVDVWVVFFFINILDYFVLVWGVQWVGLWFVVVFLKLMVVEVDYILVDSGVEMLIVGVDLVDVVIVLIVLCMWFSLGGVIIGFEFWEEIVVVMFVIFIVDEIVGVVMLYLSGIMGCLKGVCYVMLLDIVIDGMMLLVMLVYGVFGLGLDSIYLLIVLFYYVVLFGWMMLLQKFGGMVVLMSKFDLEVVLKFIE